MDLPHRAITIDRALWPRHALAWAVAILLCLLIRPEPSFEMKPGEWRLTSRTPFSPARNEDRCFSGKTSNLPRYLAGETVQLERGKTRVLSTERGRIEGRYRSSGTSGVPSGPQFVWGNYGPNYLNAYRLDFFLIVPLLTRGTARRLADCD